MRRLHLISPSKLDLAELCAFPWSELAPAWPTGDTSEAAAHGSAVGKSAECLAIFGDAPIDEIAAHYGVPIAPLRHCTSAVREFLEAEPADWRACELALAYDLTTGAVRETLPPVVHDGVRVYPDARDGEMCMSLDMVSRRGELLVIDDWKTGFGNKQKDVRTAWQLRVYGVCAAKFFGVDHVLIRYLHADQSAVCVDATDLDAFDLAVIEGAARSLIAKVAVATPLLADDVPKPGAHCARLYCPIISVCPVTTKAIAKVDRGLSNLPFSPEIESDEHAAQLYVQVRMVEAATKAVKDALRARASRRPIAVGDDVFYGAIQHNGRERVDMTVPGAEAIVRDLLGADGAGVALEIESSKAALHRGARLAAGKSGRKISDVLSEVLDRLRQLGAIKQGAAYTTVEEYSAKKREEDAA